MFGFSKPERISKKLTKFSVTFILGAATGIALGLLYAPKSGQKLQKDLKKGFGKVRDVVEDKTEDVVDSLKGAGNTVQGFVRKVANA